MMKTSLFDSYRVEDRGHETPCWVWMHCIDPRLGYGVIGLTGGGTKTAHRYLYEAIHGPVDAGMDVDHLCRQRDCVNPEHLEVVTHAENCRRGASAKLTPEKVRAIRRSKEKPGVLAGRYGIDRTTVWKVRRGMTWVGV